MAIRNLRYDGDEILNTFRDEKIDVLIGTQKVVEGEHVAGVT